MGNGRKGLAVLALAVALGGAACVPRASVAPTSTAPSCAQSTLASQLVTLANQARAYAGVRPLAWDGQLGCLATEWSKYMASTGTLQHRDLNATIRTAAYSSYRTLGENILRGPISMTAQQMHNAWMASPGHRANILSASYTKIGIGSAVSGSTIYVTQNFGG